LDGINGRSDDNQSVGGVCTGCQLWDAVEILKSDIKHIEICLPSNYVRKQDMSDLKHDIEARFDKIDNTLEKLFEKLDTKADK
jgi:hypothetical protein